MNGNAMKTAAGYAAGLIFGLGLAISGMTDPARVLGFLDVAGAWDPTLMFVLGGAVVTTFIGYRLVFKRSAPLLGGVFQLPTKKELDGKLLGGAALFGIGWGAFRLLPWACHRLYWRHITPASGHAGDDGAGVVCR